MRSCIKAWMSLNFGHLTRELAALECLKIGVSTFSRLLFKLACNEDIHNVLDEFNFQPDWTTDGGVSSP